MLQNYKQYVYIAISITLLLFIKQIILVCGVVYAFNFVKSNLLFANDREEFIKKFLGGVDNE
jgi:hypothetical protein